MAANLIQRTGEAWILQNNGQTDDNEEVLNESFARIQGLFVRQRPVKQPGFGERSLTSWTSRFNDDAE